MRLDYKIVSKLTEGMAYWGTNITFIELEDFRGHWTKYDGRLKFFKDFLLPPAYPIHFS